MQKNINVVLIPMERDPRYAASATTFTLPYSNPIPKKQNALSCLHNLHAIIITTPSDLADLTQ